MASLSARCCCCCSFWPTSLTLHTISLAGPRATHHILSMLAAAAATGQRSNNNNNRAKWGMKKKWNSLNVHKWKKEALVDWGERERVWEIVWWANNSEREKKYEKKFAYIQIYRKRGVMHILLVGPNTQSERERTHTIYLEKKSYGRGWPVLGSVSAPHQAASGKGRGEKKNV